MRLGDAGEGVLQALVKQDLFKGAKTGKLEFSKHCVIVSRLESSLTL